MSIWGALAGGFAGTLVLTTILRAASERRLTRIDIPFLLGTALTANRLRAKALGYALHFLAGFVFALLYYAIFVAIDRSGWWLGAIFGLVHALFAGTALVNLLLPLPLPLLPALVGVAEVLQLPDQSTDAPLAVVPPHHGPDRPAACAQIRR